MTILKKLEVLNNIIYLDKKFISDYYESCFDISPSTTITSNTGKKAGAGAFSFSAEISAQESKTFSISTLQMLFGSLPKITCHESLNLENYSTGMASKYGWVEGMLTSFHLKRRSGGEVIASSDHFLLRLKNGKNLDFITTIDYFSSGFEAFLKLNETLLDKFEIPVMAYVRLLPAHDHQKNWIAVPLLIIEGADKMDYSYIE